MPGSADTNLEYRIPASTASRIKVGTGLPPTAVQTFKFDCPTLKNIFVKATTAEVVLCSLGIHNELISLSEGITKQPASPKWLQ